MQLLKSAHGFTLVEVMIVIVIIGVLAAIAIPAYTDYLIRSRVSELLNASSTAKATVTEYRLYNNVMPSNTSEAGIMNVTSRYVSGVSVGANGVITITGNQTTLGSGSPIAIILTPTFTSGAINWTCSVTGAIQYAPSSCK